MTPAAALLRPPSFPSILVKSGQLDTAKMMAQRAAGRNGRMMKKLPTAMRAMITRAARFSICSELRSILPLLGCPSLIPVCIHIDTLQTGE